MLRLKKIMPIVLLFLTTGSNILPERSNEYALTLEELKELILESKKEDHSPDLTSEDLREMRSVNPKVSWTFIIYMAADNDLHYFAWKNLKQLEQIGSNENISIVVQLNTPGYLNPTKRYVIKKGRRMLVQDDESPQQKLNSGIPSTLVNCATWAISHYPADNYALILWNHGTGAMDPHIARTINPCDLFYLNPIDNKLEIDRSLGYLSLICNEVQDTIRVDNKRGICFDDTFKTYLSNSDLEKALKEINQEFAVIGFDACLMSMIEITAICKKYAQYFVASQEIEYGTGWKYDAVLEPFTKGTLTPKEFAIHIVNAYEQTYSKLINDYTLSAIDLQQSSLLEDNINTVAEIIHSALTLQQGRSVSDILRKCKSTQYCTCFEEPTYIDIGHFYQNLLQHIQHIVLKDKNKESAIKAALNTSILSGLEYLKSIVIENKVGPKLKKAHGISIYFPERTLSSNYPSSPFGKQNFWNAMLLKYILG